jgi:poly(3-hydroxyalkanoate) synthetase
MNTQLAALNVVIDDIGSPLDLIGLCQGGWLSLVYAARFPKKVRRLVLAGAPVDIKAELSLLSTPANPMTDVLIDELVRLGDGLVLGRYLAALWPRELDETSNVIKSLQIGGPPATDTERCTAANFARWSRRALDLPGPYYRQVFDWLYHENRLAVGTFPALGRRIDLRNLHCPLFLLAGAHDVIAPPAQVFAAASLVATRKSDIETALAPCGHFALFMGKSTLSEEWPRIARWLQNSAPRIGDA